MKTLIGRSPIHGRGLFAARGIRRGELIGVFRGRKAKRNSPYVLWLDEDAKEGILVTNRLRFANHSPSPNAQCRGVRLVARRKIWPGEEITINYNG